MSIFIYIIFKNKNRTNHDVYVDFTEWSAEFREKIATYILM